MICAPSCSAKDAGGPKALAVNITFCEVLTDAMAALKLALFAPAGIITVAGTETAVLLLARLTVIPPAAHGAFTVIVQLSVPAPEIEPFAQLSPLNFGIPVPCNLTIHDAAVEELLVSVREPTASPAAAGSNPTLTVAVSPGFKVNGKLAPVVVKPVPANAGWLIVTGAVPVEVSVTGWAAVSLTPTSPKVKSPGAHLSVGTTAPSCNANVSDVPAALAVRFAVSIEVTVETIAVKLAPVAPAATVTEAGTATAALSLARFTTMPPLGAAPLSATVQASGVDPVTALLAQLNELKFAALTGAPVPLRPTCIVAPVDELLVTVS